MLRRWAPIALIGTLAACAPAGSLTAAVQAPAVTSVEADAAAPAAARDRGVDLPSSSVPTTRAAVVAPTTTAPVLPPRPAAYEPRPGEVDGEAKRLGAQVAAALTTYDPTDTPATVVAALVADPAARDALAAAAAPLWHAGRWSRGTVLYPQFGGLTADAASLMVVVRQDVGSGPTVELSETRTLDVRVVRVDGRWVLDRLASAGGERAERPASLSPQAQAVLDDPRIVLPDSARWDIYRGAIEPALLGLMAAMAEQSPFAVTVLESGHPTNVFNTGRRSAHSVGAAVDVYRIGAELVVDSPGSGSPTGRMASWVYGRPDLSQLGAPWDLAEGDRAFSDAVHRDHLHIAA